MIFFITLTIIGVGVLITTYVMYYRIYNFLKPKKRALSILSKDNNSQAEEGSEHDEQFISAEALA